MYPASIFLNYFARITMLVWILHMDDMDRTPILDSISALVAQNQDLQESEALIYSSRLYVICVLKLKFLNLKEKKRYC